MMDFSEPSQQYVVMEYRSGIVVYSGPSEFRAAVALDPGTQYAKHGLLDTARALCEAACARARESQGCYGAIITRKVEV